MAFPVLLLPLLAIGAEPRVIVTGDREVVEQALSHGVRDRVEVGWSVVDVRTENDEFVVTVGKALVFERHVLHFDHRDSYRVEPAASAPADPNEPSDFLLAAVAAPRGGLVVSSGCGGYSDRAYIIDDEANGEFAPALVSRALATADDITSAASHDGYATFTLRKRGVERDLVIWVDPKGKVIEAQLRRFDTFSGGGSYKRTGELRRALRKTRVIGVVDHGATLALVTPTGKFVIDPDGASFEYSDEGEGCGC